MADEQELRSIIKNYQNELFIAQENNRYLKERKSYYKELSNCTFIINTVNDQFARDYAALREAFPGKIMLHNSKIIYTFRVYLEKNMSVISSYSVNLFLSNIKITIRDLQLNDDGLNIDSDQLINTISDIRKYVINIVNAQNVRSLIKSINNLHDSSYNEFNGELHNNSQYDCQILLPDINCINMQTCA